MRAEIRRPVNTLDASGKAILQSWQMIVPEHNIDLVPIQPLSLRERFSAEQLKIQITHSVFPLDLKNLKAVRLGDFYFAIDGKIYNIIEKTGDDELGYFRVWSNDAGFEPVSAAVNRSYYSADGLAPSTYIFGSGSLASIPAFSASPIAFFTKKNAGDFYIPAFSATGFTLGDKGSGDVPQVDVRLYENLSTGNGGMWIFTGLTPNTYRFGIGSLAGMPCHIFPSPDVFGYDQVAGRHYTPTVTSTGFTLADAGAGDPPVVTVVIWEKPKAGENRWSISGLSPGAYTFGTGVLSEIKGIINVPDIYAQNTNAGDHYLTSISNTGFTIGDQGAGDVPSVNVVIVKK